MKATSDVLSLGMRGALFIATVLSLTSCAEPVVPRQEVFHEADYRGYGGSGSGSVVGRAYVNMRDKTQHAAVNGIVQASPVNAYTTEIVKVGYERNRDLPAADLRFLRYVHTVNADENGNFEIRHLPDGEYYITSAVYFTHWFWNDDYSEKVTMQDCVPVYTEVTIKGGQTVRITDWNYGRQTSK